MRWVPFGGSPERATRLPWIVLGWLGLLLLLVWDPVATPGPNLCGMRYTVGLPCPLCGMTRGASRVVRADPVGATAHNPLSVPAFAVLFGLLVVWTAEYALGRRLEVSVPGWARRLGWAALYGSLIATWLYQLAYHREDTFAGSWLGRLIGGG